VIQTPHADLTRRFLTSARMNPDGWSSAPPLLFLWGGGVPMSSPLAGRILVVDDDDIFLRVCVRALAGSGLLIDATTNPRDALERSRHVRFDVIVSDVRMPELDGLMLMDAIQQRDSSIPFVLMTGSELDDDSFGTSSPGFFRLIQKPFDVDHFIRIVTAAVVKSGSTHEGAQLNHKLDGALSKMWMAYQPIVAPSSSSIFAYESLFRTSAPDVKGPLEMLDLAEATLRLFDVGRAIRSRVAQDITALRGDALIFVNLHSADLEDPDLYSPSAPLTAHSHRVVLEVTERASVLHLADLDANIARLRELGYRIAIDDLGTGYSDLASVARIRPDFVKLDQSLVRGIDASDAQRTVVHSMSALTSEMKAILIAEAIETEAEARTLRHLGLDLLQGFYFARPQPNFAEANDVLAFRDAA
jgi:EAL domain-containing protein (putative c-di-GMP-specific phosphodiesterase class I)